MMQTTLQQLSHNNDLKSARERETMKRDQFRRDLQSQRITNIFEREKKRLYLTKNELAINGKMLKEELPLKLVKKTDHVDKIN